MQQFKIRASAIGNIVALPRAKKDRDQLSKGAQTYVKDWLKGQSAFFNRRKDVTSKYTYKGHAVEDDSIEFAAEMMGYPFLFKNEEHFENEYCKGTPDVIISDTVIDLKNSWDFSTFPYFETEIPDKKYWWQGQGYMWLTGRQKYQLVYTLMDAPEEQIYSEARRYCYANHLDLDLYFEEVYEEMEEKLTYSDLDPSLRIKVFEFGIDPEAIELIQNRVEAARVYVDELLKKINV